MSKNKKNKNDDNKLEMNTNIKRVFYIIFALFVLLALHISKFALFDSKKLITNSYNSRLNMIDNKIKKGNIYDRNGSVLAETKGEVNSYKRHYTYPSEFSHILGYIYSGRYGIEGSFSVEMQKLFLEIVQRTNQIITGDDLSGNHLVSTLDLNLQLEAYNLLGNNRGSVIVMEPDTGKILAMVSKPAFDTNNIESTYEELKNNTERSALVDRSRQGLYPPGSIFKVITLASAIEYLPDYASFTYNCPGSITIEGNTIACANNKVHGEVNYLSAMTYSCNGFFISLSQKIGAENLLATAEKFYFNKDINFSLEYNISKFKQINPSNKTLLAESSIGQGEVLATPLHMATIFSAIANGGIMMKPYVVDRMENKNGSTVKQYVPEKIAEILELKEASIISDSLVLVASEGTGTAASIDGVKVAAKTGTAENPKGQDHAWFASYAPADNPKVCVLILVEHGGYGSSFATAAKTLMQMALK